MAAAPQVPLLNANLMTVALESLLYGVFLTLAVLSIYLLVSHHLGERNAMPATGRTSKWILVRKPMFVAAVLLSFICTGHWILTVIRSFQAFIQLNGDNTPTDFYADLSQLTEVVKTGFLSASLWTSDAVIIYRLWIIYGRSTKIILFPIGTLIGLGICSIGITFQFTQFVVGEVVFVSAAGRWITSDCVFILCTNLYCTTAIGLRVWRTHRAVQVYGGLSVLSLLAIIVESAAIHTTWTIFFFTTYQSGSNLQFTVCDTWPQVSGIAFMLINVRFGLGWAATSGHSEGLASESGISHACGVGGRGAANRRPQWEPYSGRQTDGPTKDGETEDMELGAVGRPGRPLEVNILQVMHVDGKPQYDSKSRPFESFSDI